MAISSRSTEFIEADDGCRIAVRSFGERTELPALVLIHGGPGMWDYFEDLALDLARHTRVYSYDQRGCGQSEQLRPYTMARFDADLEALRRWAGEPKIAVVGHSFGAYLALAYAAQHPESTAALCYLSGLGPGDWRGIFRSNLRSKNSAQDQQELDGLSVLAQRSKSEEIRYRALSWATDYADLQFGRRLAHRDAAELRALNYELHREIWDECRGWEESFLLELARSLRVPASFIHGAEDPRPFQNVQKLAEQAPGAEICPITRGGTHALAGRSGRH